MPSKLFDNTTSDRLRASLGAGVAILIMGLLLRTLLPSGAHPILVIPPIGATAVLIFVVPASPMSQPWAVMGGNLLSAVGGVTVTLLIGDHVVAGAVAVGAAIAIMAMGRCMHPPGAAVALFAATNGAQSYGFAVMPVLVDVVIVLAVAWAYHRVSGHSYPHRPTMLVPKPIAREFNRDDLRKALAAYPDRLDVSLADLEVVLHAAESNADERRKQG